MGEIEVTYDLDYFIDKFEAIPQNLWCTGEFKKGNRCCVLGHVGARKKRPPSKEMVELVDLINRLHPEHLEFCDPLVLVNDGEYLSFQQRTPKQRVLAYLKDLKRFYE